ncbi:tetratricopeptide repeat protein [Streptomyces sp. MMG1533]|uniref:tetratricopeptide repeat protein n=1 Tax=Streptomyces sp. MMG1533 TaxID=1415546 RepID=UPI000ACC0EB2|nr:tetratricopeptide repeat protein [Streptomyces sp. MMG1533]
MAAPQATFEPLLRFCGSLRELRIVSGEPSYADLARRAPGRLAGGTLSPLLAGKIRRAPRWELVRDFVGACREHAQANGITLPEDQVSPDAWRRRHEDLVRALNGAPAQRSPDELVRLLHMAPDNRPPTLGELADSDLGVSRPLPGADAGYIARADFDVEMRSLLSLEGPPYPYVIAYGEEGAGKTRSAVEALRAQFPAETPILIPRDTAAVSELRSLADSLDRLGRPVVVWLDDLTAADLEHLTPELREWLSGWAVTAGTIQARRFREIREETASGAGAVSRAALHGACLVHLPLELGDAERAQAVWHFEDAAVPRSFAEAADVPQALEMLLRLNTAGAANQVGVCVVRAAIDCHRAGLVRGLTRDELLRLLPSYLTSLGAPPATDAQFEQGLSWAQAPVARGRALLQPWAHGSGEPRWEPARELVTEADSGPVPGFAWTEVIDLATPEECAGIGYEAMGRKALVYAAEAFTRAAEYEPCRPYVLLALGQTRHLLGFDTAAKDAFRGVIEMGDPVAVAAEAALRLGDVLRKEGDTAGAEEAWRLAAATGDEYHAPMALHQMGLMRVKQHDFTEETESFFRQAAASGDPEIAPRSWVLVATLREYHGDPQGALAAYERAAEWDNPHVMATLEDSVSELRARMAELTEVGGSGPGAESDAEDLLERAELLEELGDPAGALAAFTSAADCEDPDVRARALYGAAGILTAEDRIDEACEAYEAVAECGVPERVAEALFELGMILHRTEDWAGAHRAWSRAAQTGVPGPAQWAALNLGLLELRVENTEAAATAFRRALETQDAPVRAQAALNLALLGADGGADEEAVDAWYRIAIESEDPEFMPQAALALAGRLIGRGLRNEPKRLIDKAVDSGDPESAVRGPLLLGMLQECDADEDGAAALYRKAIEFGHAKHSIHAHVLLGRLCIRTGRPDAARWHLQTALDAGHPDHSPEAGVLLARVFRDNGESDKAQLLLRQLVEMGHPDAAPEAGVMLGDVLVRGGRTEEARKVWKRVVEQGREPHAGNARARLAAFDGNGD